MKGLELSRLYFEQIGLPMLKLRFSDLMPRIAAGMVGQGSDCLGFDDDISQDHDFGPAFCLWLTDFDFVRYGEALQHEYDLLLPSFMGYARNATARGVGRVGVMRTSDFYRFFIGCPGIPESLLKWIRIQEHFLATCTSGTVFRDDLGEFTAIRNGLLPCYPDDIRKKKLAARAASMAQSGQYNFVRVMRRGDIFGARLALAEFLNASLSMLYLLNFRYAPFYKWQFTGAKGLIAMGEALPFLKDIAASSTRRDDKALFYNVEAVSAIAISALREQGLTDAQGDYLEPHAYSILDHINDEETRCMHVMEG